MDNKVVVTLYDHMKNTKTDLELDLDISALELFNGLNEAYQWGIDASDIQNSYLSMENPIALLRGNRKLSAFGVRDGSVIHYIRHGS